VSNPPPLRPRKKKESCAGNHPRLRRKRKRGRKKLPVRPTDGPDRLPKRSMRKRSLKRRKKNARGGGAVGLACNRIAPVPSSLWAFSV
jgi:hypothetical protein